MRKYLLPILLIGFWGCEDAELIQDSTEPDFEFVEEWVLCKLHSQIRTAEDGSYNNEITYSWDGNVTTQYTNGEEDGSIMEYNQYGFITKSIWVSAGWITTFEYDKWKRLSETTIDANGDTLSHYDYSWDGLTQTGTSIEGNHWNSVKIYNEYGRFLESWEINPNDGSLHNHTVRTYEDDGRRSLTRTVDNQIITQTEWNINEYESIVYANGVMSQKIIGTINEYYHTMDYQRYFYEDNNWILEETVVLENECPGFEQIYP